MLTSFLCAFRFCAFNHLFNFVDESGELRGVYQCQRCSKISIGVARSRNAPFEPLSSVAKGKNEHVRSHDFSKEILHSAMEAGSNSSSEGGGSGSVRYGGDVSSPCPD